MIKPDSWEYFEMYQVILFLWLTYNIFHNSFLIYDFYL